MSATKTLPADRIYSRGYVCQSLRISPDQLRGLMEAAGVTFVRAIDGVAYVDAKGFDLLADQCRKGLAC